MSTYTDIADFSTQGFNIGQDQKVLTYLHGLSDFWIYMFDDASKINLMMEADALRASDIYNQFLQLTSVISLEGISTLTNSQLKLILISDEANSGVANPAVGRVAGQVETYYLPKDVGLQYAKFLGNRPFLPTSLLENEADYFIDEVAGTIAFARPLSDIGFPFRILSDGSRQYALWAVDAKVDQQLIYNYYAKLISVSPTSSSDLFKQFVYGLYYLYVNGPNLDTMRRGLNLVLGIPLARDDNETILEVKKYLNTDQWLVISDKNSYLVPYGLEPTIEVDDVLSTGDEIANWIEVKDYINDGEWWINFMLPAHIMPFIPSSIPGGGGVDADAIPDRYMLAGSYADWIMRNYLKTNTFLVNVKTIGFKNIQSFEQLASIIHTVKPSYTTPIYVWSVPVQTEFIEMADILQYSFTIPPIEPVGGGIERFVRDSLQPLSRGTPLYIRMSGPQSWDDQLGYNEDFNKSDKSINNGQITGFIAPHKSYRTLTTKEVAIGRMFRSRFHEQYVPRKGKLDFRRDPDLAGVDGKPVLPFYGTYDNRRLVYLYTTTKIDLQEKFASVGAGELPDKYMFELFKPTYVIDLINANALDDSYALTFYDVIINNFDYFFTPGVHGRYLGPFFGKDSYVTYKPDQGDVLQTDFLVFTRIGHDKYAAFWATSNFGLETNPYIKHDVDDPLTLTITGRASRGMAPHGSPFYLLRGSGSLSYNTSNAINEKAINENFDPSSFILSRYNDDLNNLTVTRAGVNLVTKRTWH